MDAASIGKRVPRLRALVESRNELAAQNVRLEAQCGALAADHLQLTTERDQLAASCAQLQAQYDELTGSVARYGMWPPGHFYSPHPDLDEVQRDQARLFDRRIDSVLGLDLLVKRQLKLLDVLGPLSRSQPFSDQPDGRHRYYYGNTWFGPGDAIVYHCLLRHLRPERVIEVGIGFSSALLLDTNDEFLDQSCSATFIDPYPERMLELLGADDESVNVVAEPVQNVGQELFSTLKSGDILFIDSSHVTKAGSDVNYLYFEILPSLPSGVYVHIHDIFWPFEYTKEWVLEGRAWNEAYLLHAYLIGNQNMEVVWFNDYLGLQHRERVSSSLAMWDQNSGGSLWLRSK
jgi:hypothetical protein